MATARSATTSYLVKPVSCESFLDMVRRIDDDWSALNVGPPAETSGSRSSKQEV